MSLIEDIRRPSSPVRDTSVAPVPQSNIRLLAEEDIVPQPASPLLALPPELRLMICSYMTLSPEFADSLLWGGRLYLMSSATQGHARPTQPGK